MEPASMGRASELQNAPMPTGPMTGPIMMRPWMRRATDGAVAMAISPHARTDCRQHGRQVERHWKRVRRPAN